MNRPSGSVNGSNASLYIATLHMMLGNAPHDAWEWVWDRFWSFTMHSNGTLLLDAPLDGPLDAWCVYTLRVADSKGSIPGEVSDFFYKFYVVEFLLIRREL